MKKTFNSFSASLDTSFILSIIIQRDNTAMALEILSFIVEHYDRIFVPNQAIVETIYVLEGIHKFNPGMSRLQKHEIINYIYAIINTPKVFIENKKIIEKAFDLYLTQKLDFGDSLIAAAILYKGIKEIVSFDNDFLKIQEFKVIHDLNGIISKT